MVFSSTIFLIFFLPVLIIVYYLPLIHSRSYRNTVLLLGSLFFYAWGEPIYVFLLILCVLIGWALGIEVERSKRKGLICTAGVLFYVCVFFIFKYLSFFSGELFHLFRLGETPIHIALPIGISFYLFQLLSYLFDVTSGKTEAKKDLRELALYVALFPQLIAGPIVRYADIAEQIRERKETSEDFSTGIIRFAYGLGKKVLIANYMGVLADASFGRIEQGNTISVLMAWLGACAYTLQIFFDFSGYSDMAIGLGRMFGFRFRENFQYPYISASLTEFWRRWHISLSSWFRDYVYIPAGGNRKGKKIWIRNMLTVWLLTGIWHGANWTFILWGFFYCIFLIIEKLGDIPSKLQKNVAGRIIAHIYTMLVVILLWVLFRSQSISLAGKYILNMFGVTDRGAIDSRFLYYLRNSWIVWIIAILFCLPSPAKLAEYGDNGKGKALYYFFAVIVFLISLCVCIGSDYNPFIYFNF